jgi:hypothetical protein
MMLALATAAAATLVSPGPTHAYDAGPNTLLGVADTPAGPMFLAEGVGAQGLRVLSATGTFGSVSYTVPRSGAEAFVVAADLDGDGTDEWVWTLPGGGMVSYDVFTGRVVARLGLTPSFVGGEWTGAVDLDGDGIDELFGNLCGTVDPFCVVDRRGAIWWQGPVAYRAEPIQHDASPALELLVDDQIVDAYLGTPLASIPPSLLGAGHLVVVDVDGDGPDDIVTVGADVRVVDWREQTQTWQTLLSAPSWWAPAVADFDGDGLDDLAVSQRVLRGIDGGSLTYPGVAECTHPLVGARAAGSPLLACHGRHLITDADGIAAECPGAGSVDTIHGVDLDGDGRREVVAIGAHVTAYDADGDKLHATYALSSSNASVLRLPSGDNRLVRTDAGVARVRFDRSRGFSPGSSVVPSTTPMPSPRFVDVLAPPGREWLFGGPGIWYAIDPTSGGVVSVTAPFGDLVTAADLDGVPGIDTWTRFSRDVHVDAGVFDVDGYITEATVGGETWLVVADDGLVRIYDFRTSTSPVYTHVLQESSDEVWFLDDRLWYVGSGGVMAESIHGGDAWSFPGALLSGPPVRTRDAVWFSGPSQELSRWPLP